MRQIYLDYNATQPIAPAVQQALLPFLAEHYGDPGSNHAIGKAALEAVEDARGRVAAHLGADRDEIVFTSGGTESNHLALVGTLLARENDGGHVLISAIEHESVAGAARMVERGGYEVTFIPANSQGIVTAAAVRQALRPNTVLVSVMHANHELGTIQPIKQIAAVCHEANVLLHTDASQTAGRIRTQVDELEVDLLTLTGHKLYGPKGVGALYVRQGITLEALQSGGGQENGVRGGTENVFGIVGLGKACELVHHSYEEALSRMEMLRNRFEVQLQEAVGDGLVIHGQLVERLPNTSCLSFPGVQAYEMLQRAPELCLWTGSTGYATANRASATLAAIGVTGEVAQGTLRMSAGWYTTEEEIDRAVSLLLEAWEALK